MAFVKRWWVRILVVALLAAALVYAFMPQPVPVDMARAERATMTVTVSDEGETRVREIYVISTPIGGRVMRFVGDVGDTVAAGDTVARILPTDPGMLDLRTRTELQSAERAAEAAKALADADLRRREAEVDFARSEYRRAQNLADRGTISEAALDRALKDLRMAEATLMTAEAAVRQREFELESARAALIEPELGGAAEERAAGAPAEDDVDGSVEDGNSDACCYTVRSPVAGQILEIAQESESVVRAGQALVTVGDPSQLEIVTDFLSTDAVRIEEGDPVLIERWGGEGTLDGRVRRVEPTGFTKVSSLGVEEQRVNVVTDITAPRARWERLGHGFRVETRVVLWREEDVLQVPLSALFRDGDGWAVFAAGDGTAKLTQVDVGRMTAETAQILSGLDAGMPVVLHPSDRVQDGTPVVQRDL